MGESREGGNRPSSSRKEIETLFARFPRLLTLPLHVCVDDRSFRSGKRDVVSHVEPAAIFGTQFLQAAPGVFVASPELCLAQLSRGRHPARVAQIAFELCGSYRRDSRNSAGFVAASPLTDLEKVKRFMDEAPERFKGIGSLKKVIAFVLEGSRSPMETDVAILFSFSRRRGGRGYVGFNLNGLVEVPPLLVDSVNQPYYHVDFLWPEKRVAVEYDSDLAHLGSERIARDATRKNSLQLLGYTTLTLTRMQLMDWDSFCLFANALEKAIGVKKRPASRNYSGEQKALWRLLLGSFAQRMALGGV